MTDRRLLQPRDENETELALAIHRELRNMHALSVFPADDVGKEAAKRAAQEIRAGETSVTVVMRTSTTTVGRVVHRISIWTEPTLMDENRPNIQSQVLIADAGGEIGKASHQQFGSARDAARYEWTLKTLAGASGESTDSDAK